LPEVWLALLQALLFKLRLNSLGSSFDSGRRHWRVGAARFMRSLSEAPKDAGFSAFGGSTGGFANCAASFSATCCVGEGEGFFKGFASFCGKACIREAVITQSSSMSKLEHFHGFDSRLLMPSSQSWISSTIGPALLPGFQVLSPNCGH